MSEATRVTAILGAVAVCYNIFLYILYLDIAFSHHVNFQESGNLKTGITSCLMKIRQVYEIFSSLFREENQKSYLRERNTYFLL